MKTMRKIYLLGFALLFNYVSVLAGAGWGKSAMTISINGTEKTYVFNAQGAEQGHASQAFWYSYEEGIIYRDVPTELGKVTQLNLLDAYGYGAKKSEGSVAEPYDNTTFKLHYRVYLKGEENLPDWITIDLNNSYRDYIMGDFNYVIYNNPGNINLLSGLRPSSEYQLEVVLSKRQISSSTGNPYTSMIPNVGSSSAQSTSYNAHNSGYKITFTTPDAIEGEEAEIEDFNDITVGLGAEPITLDARVAGERPITYSIEANKQDVATLEGNVLTIVGEGIVHIIATAEANNNYRASQKTITLTVVDYAWMEGVAISVEGNIARVVGPAEQVSKFTKIFVNGAETLGNIVDISTATGEIEIKATTDDGNGVVRLKIEK